jgi:hypothetical protein
MKTLDHLYDETVAFANAQFGVIPPRRLSAAKHLLKEAGELKKDIEDNVAPETWLEEAADVFLLLSHLTSDDKSAFSQAIEAKLAKNRLRVWAEADAEGIISHVRGIHD